MSEPSGEATTRSPGASGPADGATSGREISTWVESESAIAAPYCTLGA